MTNTQKITQTALELFEKLEQFSCFEKQDVVAVLNTLVELEVRRYLRTTQKDRPR